MSDVPLVHVVDDDESQRTALLRLLSAGGFDAQGYASTGDFLLQPLPERHGCIVLDVRLPGPSGLDLQEALASRGVTLPIVFLTGHANVTSAVRAMKAGAVDFLSKPVERETLFEAIGRALVRDEARRASRDEAIRLRERFASLTAREREVLDLIVAGRLNKQIADQIGLAERTVKAERAQLMAKLGASSPAELGVMAERLRTLSEE
jgi:FixJ family two-component response regulator